MLESGARVQQIDIVLIGPPCSGKGTQASLISKQFGVPAVSTGDILRAAVKTRSALGRRVQAIMRAGDLVDDGTIVDLVRQRLAQSDTVNGFILDGFPRTVVQAEALETILAGRPILALVLSVPQAELERRLDARRVCSTCKALYSRGTRYGSELELCSRCGGVLIQRDDDNLATIRARLEIYRDTTEPVVGFYRARGETVLVDASGSPDAVGDALVAEIERVRRSR